MTREVRTDRERVVEGWERGEGEGAKSEVALWEEFGRENPNGAGVAFSQSLTVLVASHPCCPDPEEPEGSERSEGILPFVTIVIVIAMSLPLPPLPLLLCCYCCCVTGPAAFCWSRLLWLHLVALFTLQLFTIHYSDPW